MEFQDKINDKNLFKDFGLVIQTGTAELLEFPERKEPVSQDWADENGQAYDLDAPRFKDKEARLHLAFIAKSDAAFWKAYHAFFDELKKPGYQKLYIDDHSHSYNVFYKHSGAFKKGAKRLKGVDTILVKFELILQVEF